MTLSEGTLSVAFPVYNDRKAGRDRPFWSANGSGLAAIVATDIVGYSRLMGEDELGTLSAILRLRSDVIDPAIAARGGRLVKAMEMASP